MSETLLKIEHLTHRFGGLQALTDINVELEKGTINALIGPNGAGKTTVFNLVSGFYIPSEGDIIFDVTTTFCWCMTMRTATSFLTAHDLTV